MSSAPDLTSTLKDAESYIEERLFDPYGIMYSYIDIQTGKPFAPGVLTPAIAWAEKWTAEAKWKDYLEAKQGLFKSDGYFLFRDGRGAFC